MVVFLLVALVFAFAAAVEASVGVKQVKVNYNDYRITVDGKLVNLPAGVEPFILNGTTYVPLRVVGEALNCNVSWQGEAKTVAITSGTNAEVYSLRMQILSKDKEIEELKKQVADLQRELADAERGGNLPELERDLLDDFDEIEDVPVDDIELDGDKYEVDVVVEVDLDDFEDEWADLDDRDIENWLEDLVDEIQDELSGDTEVFGEIINNDNGDVLVEFYRDGDDDLEIDFEDEDYRGAGVNDVEDDLDGDIYKVDDLAFSVHYVDYDKHTDEIEVEMYAEDDDAMKRWNELDESDIEDDVERICEDIAEAFEDDARVDPEWVYIDFYDEFSRFIESYEYDVDDGSLD